MLAVTIILAKITSSALGDRNRLEFASCTAFGRPLIPLTAQPAPGGWGRSLGQPRWLHYFPLFLFLAGKSIFLRFLLVCFWRLLLLIIFFLDSFVIAAILGLLVNFYVIIEPQVVSSGWGPTVLRNIVNFFKPTLVFPYCSKSEFYFSSLFPTAYVDGVAPCSAPPSPAPFSALQTPHLHPSGMCPLPPVPLAPLFHSGIAVKFLSFGRQLCEQKR